MVVLLTFVLASGCGESASPQRSFSTAPTPSVATTSVTQTGGSVSLYDAVMPERGYETGSAATDSPITSTSGKAPQPTTTTTRATSVKPSAPTTTTSIGAPAKPSGPTSLVLSDGQTPLKGKWSGTAEQLASYLLGVCPSPNFGVPTSVLADYYVRYCAEAGLRADLLWAQMIHETGYGMYGGDVLPGQNNYAGIGATGGGNPGYSFPTAEAGVRAQVAHMVAYVYADSPVSWADATTDPRFNLVSPRGAVSVLADLNGHWAVPGTTYGQRIEAIARKINSN
jgi:hypothetical protein